MVTTTSISRLHPSESFAKHKFKTPLKLGSLESERERGEGGREGGGEGEGGGRGREIPIP